MFATLLKWFYRITAPRHPRGWLDFHAVGEEEDATGLWIHCHGMERWDLPNLEIVDVPYDLRGFAHGIMFDLVGYMKDVKPIRPDENFGGAWVGGDEQPVHHAGTMRMAPERDGHVGMLRIVDEGEELGAGFPRRLFAAHMIALAYNMRDPVRQEALFRRTIEMWPGQPAESETGYRFGDNPNNFFAWNGLGDALCDQGRIEEGLAALREAVSRCPDWARDFAKFVRETTDPQGHGDPRFKFWSAIDAIGPQSD